MPILCECGCGEPVRYRRGRPNKFVHGHHIKGEGNPKWNGGVRSTREDGYIQIWSPNHPHRSKDKYVFQHILVIEKAMGKYMPPNAVAHHVNSCGGDNRNINLVACEDKAYHELLHVRTKAYFACGDAKKRMCKFCREYDNIDNLCVYGGNQFWHQACSNTYYELQKKGLTKGIDLTKVISEKYL